MRKSGSASKYTKVVPDIYENSKICRSGWSVRWIKDGDRLHQGSALGPFLFAVVKDKLTGEVKQQ